jgi:hypothetical protein
MSRSCLVDVTGEFASIEAAIRRAALGLTSPNCINTFATSNAFVRRSQSDTGTVVDAGLWSKRMSNGASTSVKGCALSPLECVRKLNPRRTLSIWELQRPRSATMMSTEPFGANDAKLRKFM